jgi:superfamily II DNA or RNA helicase
MQNQISTTTQSVLSGGKSLNIISQNSYLGKKGYTISKHCLTEIEYKSICNELMMRPKMTDHGNVAPPPAFPIYRENAKKIYVPRFYGIQKYGMPSKNLLKEGAEMIQLSFAKPLRDYQETVVETFLEKVVRTDSGGGGGGGGILSLYTGAGKTVCAIKLITEIGYKTLIVVHKEFLLNQWIERIREFAPDARIGVIQGKVCNIENKDIVLAMLQTLYNEEKTFPLDSFGFAIVDEVHRIGSGQFHKALLKINTLYCLGISATVKRKDGLDNLIYMFMGDVVHSLERTADDTLQVRGIRYSSPDEEYNEIPQDYRGEMAYSTLVSKVCNYIPRNMFLLRIIRDLIRENPSAQLLVLGHLRSMLSFLHEQLESVRVSTGFYVGGMKQEDLDETADTKQVVLSTYMMSSEALDIPSLSILVLISPKTDIIQCVGRILRRKHDNPIIVDVIDSHRVFQNQWEKRLKYYKKCNYRVITTDCDRYVDMSQFENTKIWRVDARSQRSIGMSAADGQPLLEEKKCWVQI